MLGQNQFMKTELNQPHKTLIQFNFFILNLVNSVLSHIKPTILSIDPKLFEMHKDFGSYIWNFK